MTAFINFKLNLCTLQILNNIYLNHDNWSSSLEEDVAIINYIELGDRRFTLQSIQLY